MSTIKIATVRDIIEEVHASGAKTVEQQLTVLVDKFIIAARTIDPSITGTWIGREGPAFDKPGCIVFEREESTFRRSA